MTAGQTIGEDGVGYYESDESGVYFVGNLPTGTYYIWETKAPDAYAKNEGKVYVLTVDANGVAQRELGKVEGTGLGTKATGDFGEFRDWMKVQLGL